MDIGLALLLEALVLLNDLLDGGLFGRLSSRSCCRRDGCHLGLKGISVTVGGVLALNKQGLLLALMSSFVLNMEEIGAFARAAARHVAAAASSGRGLTRVLH